MRTQYPLRQVTAADIPELRELFRSTVLHVNIKDYTQAEAEDWASCGDSIEHWQDLLAHLYYLAATDADGRIIGFAAIRNDGYLHSMFVHKDRQGEGIATTLLNAMENYAIGQGITRITSEVSLTARPFFEKRGYGVKQEQRVQAKRLVMTNFVMSKNL